MATKPCYKLIMPSDEQMQNALDMGWEYLGNGYFMKDEWFGYYTATGFVKE